ncbi:MAG: hypothetical protein JXR22_12180 [Prolixibacteraceae bacterium]|nr:hypothetical protein [Prolixibacteraceae bacterium]
MIDISISATIRAAWPEVQLSCLLCTVRNEVRNEALWNLIRDESKAIRSQLPLESISQVAAIAASRSAYRTLGKDPARYRLSAEALMRRIVKGGELYQINNVVDLVNFASLTSGFSIGGYDAARIEGPLVLDIGIENEPYEAIGRGELNVGFLPVLRDSKGAFGSPTSDSVRTSVTLETSQFLMVFFGFGAFDELERACNHAGEYLQKYAMAQNLQKLVIQ